MTKARSNAVAEATKGDLSVGTGTNLAGILAVGTNGDTLVADSSTTTGLRYQPTMAAGKNAIINGGFEIWQRGTSFSSNPSQACADRWFSGRSSVAGATFSRQTSDLNGFNYKIRVQRDSGNTSTASIFLNQSIENLNSAPFIDRPITLSFYAKAGANYSAASSGLAASLISGTGTDQNIMFVGVTGQATVASSTVTLTTSWQRFQITGTSASSAKQLFAAFTFAPVGTAGANDFYEITGVQLEVGSIATAFTNAGGTIQGELAACQRYFYRHVSGNNKAIMTAAAYSSTIIAGTVFFKTEMRTTPTLTVPNVATYFSFNANSTFKYASTLSLQEASPNAGTVFGTFEATTAGFAGYVITSNASSYVDFGAEL